MNEVTIAAAGYVLTEYETLATLTVHRPLTPAEVAWLADMLAAKACELTKGEAPAAVCEMRRPRG